MVKMKLEQILCFCVLDNVTAGLAVNCWILRAWFAQLFLDVAQKVHAPGNTSEPFKPQVLLFQAGGGGKSKDDGSKVPHMTGTKPGLPSPATASPPNRRSAMGSHAACPRLRGFSGRNVSSRPRPKVAFPREGTVNRGAGTSEHIRAGPAPHSPGVVALVSVNHKARQNYISWSSPV